MERQESRDYLRMYTESCWEKLKLGISCNYQSSPLATGFPETKSNSKKSQKKGGGIFCLKFIFLLLAGAYFIMLFQIPIPNLES